MEGNPRWTSPFCATASPKVTFFSYKLSVNDSFVFKCTDESVMKYLIHLEAVTGRRGGFTELLRANPKYLHIWYFDKGQ